MSKPGEEGPERRILPPISMPDATPSSFEPSCIALSTCVPSTSELPPASHLSAINGLRRGKRSSILTHCAGGVWQWDGATVQLAVGAHIDVVEAVLGLERRDELQLALWQPLHYSDSATNCIIYKDRLTVVTDGDAVGHDEPLGGHTARPLGARTDHCAPEDARKR